MYPEIKIDRSPSGYIARFDLNNNIIYIHKSHPEEGIESSINHETIHWLLNELFGKWESATFDNLFKNKADLSIYGPQGEPVEITGRLMES